MKKDTYTFDDLLHHFADKPEIQAQLGDNANKEIRTPAGKYNSLSECLWQVFVWDESPQGHNYWSDIAAELGLWEENSPTSA